MKKRLLLAFALLGAAALSAGPAAADETQPTLLTEWGMSISAGGGVQDFVGEEMRDTTGIGGMWDVRYQLGTRTPIAVEAAYIGSAQAIDALGLDDSAVLLGTTVEATARFNFLARDAFQPFAFAGGAWSRYDLTNADVNTSSIEDSDDVFEVPMGVGLAYRYGGILGDVRGTFRYSTEEDLVPAETAGEHQQMSRWSASARLGYEF